MKDAVNYEQKSFEERWSENGAGFHELGAGLGVFRWGLLKSRDRYDSPLQALIVCTLLCFAFAVLVWK